MSSEAAVMTEAVGFLMNTYMFTDSTLDCLSPQHESVNV